jgi:catechol 2,3-dioxygenase-like lactoylglutathione lyase family enzyme
MEGNMTKVIFGNHAALRVPRAERERIRSFYRDILGCEITRAGEQKDDVRLGGDFYIAFMYENGEAALDESEFLKPPEGRSCGWLESKRTSPNTRGPSTANSSSGGRSPDTPGRGS